MAPLLALTREISASLVRGELTHLARAPIDVDRASAQHAAYERALETCGCTVRRLPADDSMPDAVFIEDTAIVVPELAVIARSGAVSRRAETAAVTEDAGRLRPLTVIEEPGTLDGGDVLVVGRSVFVGRSTRTNADGVRQLRMLLAPHGYQVTALETRGCLHLKSAVTAIDQTTVIVNPEWVAAEPFAAFDRVEVAAGEPHAANVVGVNGRVLAAAAYPRTLERLAQRGIEVVTVDASELAKAEGALTCCSILVS